jgi:adenine C2-methylase RlmN of 23S rRNA A2503 and tRNA A37
MVDNIVNGNNLESESDFKNIMSDKVGETLEKERQTISKDMVTSHIPEVGEDEV